MLKNLIFLSLISLSSFCFAQKSFHKERFLHLRLEFQLDQKDTTGEELIRVVKFCQEKLNRHFIKVSPTTPKLHIFLEGNPPSKDYYNIVYFKRKELETLNEYAIFERILTKMMRRTIIGLGAPKTTKIPPWVVAAHVFNMRLYNIFSTEEKYPATRFAIVENKYPSLDSLLTQAPPSTDNHWLYRLYSEYCSVFLTTLNKISGHRTKLLTLLKEYNHADSLELISSHFPSLKTKIIRQRWFINACTRTCFHVLNPYPPEVIYKKVEELFSVSSLRPGSNQVNRIPLEKIFEDEDQAINYAVIAFIEKDFYEVFMTSPETLRPSLKLFIEALQKLKQNDREEFAEKITIARKQFKKSVESLKHLLSYMDELEQKKQSHAENYTEVLRVDELSSKRFKKFFPEWDTYLDNLEKKLENIVIE